MPRTGLNVQPSSQATEPDRLISQFPACTPIEEILQKPVPYQDTEEYQKIYQELENSCQSSDSSNIQKSTAPSFNLQILEEIPTPLMSTEYLDSGSKASVSKEPGLISQPLKDSACRPRGTRGSHRSRPYIIQPPGNGTSPTLEFSTSYDQGAKNMSDDVSNEENGWSDLSTENQSTADGNARACKKYRAKRKKGEDDTYNHLCRYFLANLRNPEVESLKTDILNCNDVFKNKWKNFQEHQQ